MISKRSSMNKIIRYSKDTHLTIYDIDLKSIALNYATPLLLVDAIQINNIISTLKESFKNADVIVKNNLPIYSSCMISNLLTLSLFSNNKIYYESRNKSSEEILIALENNVKNFCISNEAELDLINIVLNYFPSTYKLNIFIKTQSEYIKNAENNRCIFLKQTQNLIEKIQKNEKLVFKGVYFTIDKLENYEKIYEETQRYVNILAQYNILQTNFLIKINNNETLNTYFNEKKFFNNLIEQLNNQQIQLKFVLDNELKNCFYLLTSIGNEFAFEEDNNKINQVYFDYDFNETDSKTSSFLPYIKPLILDKNYILMNKNYSPKENFKQIKTDIINRGDLYLFKNVDIENFIQFASLHHLTRCILALSKNEDNKIELLNLN